jgi:chromosome segregation ATPase
MFSRSKKTHEALTALGADISALRSELHAHVEQLATEKALRDDVAERLTVLESRVSGMGSELSRQLHELSDEIEQLTSSNNSADDASTINALRTAQSRLATEQARYEIAFRQDLARLADMLKRNT